MEPGTHRRLHVGIAKWLLLELLTAHGAAGVLKGWTGTEAEAYDAIRSDPREFFVLDSECDNQQADGSCGGHAILAAEGRR